jgi:hypothetical protein
MSSSSSRLRAFVGSWLLVVSIVLGVPLSPQTAAVTVQSNNAFPQSAGNLGGFVVEVSEISAGNVDVELVTIDTAKQSDVEVARMTFHNNVYMEGLTITKNHQNLTRNDGYTQIHSTNYSVDRAVFYTSEVYAESWSTNGNTQSDLWTTQPGVGNQQPQSSGDPVAQNLKLNAHTMGIDDVPVDTYTVEEGTYTVQLDVSYDGG